MRLAKWLMLFLVAIRVEAAILDFKPLVVEVRAQDQLKVRGFDGDVRFIVGRGNQLTLKVKQETDEAAPVAVRQALDEWNISLQRGEAGPEIVVQSPHGKAVWRQLLMNGGAPKFHLEISGPSMPIEMAWRNGKVQLENWAAPIRVGMRDGSAVVIGGSGDVRITGQALDIRVKNRSGKIAAESFSGKVTIEQIKGNLDVESFLGDAVVSEFDGNLQLKGFRSNLLVSGGKGRVEFETVRGPVKISNFSGDLRGTSDEGAVSAKVVGAQEIRITTQSAPVNLELPGSGASISVSTVEGAISGPSHLKAEQLANSRAMRGRLKGGQDGVVVVKTQSGAIRIR